MVPSLRMTWMLVVAVCCMGAVGIAPVMAEQAAASAKWQTSEALRAHMAVIRKVTLDHHTLVTHRRMPPAEAQRFSETIRREAGIIQADAGLAAGARSEMEALLAEIVAGAEAVAGRGGEASAIDGIVGIDAALIRYGERFDDPTWQPLR